MTINNFFLIIIAALFTASAQACLKYASGEQFFKNGVSVELIFTISKNLHIWAGLVLYFFSFALSVKIYEGTNLSLVTPVFMGLVFIIVAFLSFFIFGETITKDKILGMSFVLLGIYLMV